jgi:hypothetical protein
MNVGGLDKGRRFHLARIALWNVLFSGYLAPPDRQLTGAATRAVVM